MANWIAASAKVIMAKILNGGVSPTSLILDFRDFDQL